MWRITYLDNGKYCLRPLNIMTSGLYAYPSNYNVYINDIGNSNNYSSVSSNAQWSIEYTSSGYVFKVSNSSCAMQPSELSTANSVSVNVGYYQSGQTRFCWNLTQVTSPPLGVLLYDTSTGYQVRNPTKYVVNGNTATPDSFGLKAVSYGNWNSYNAFWTSSDTSVAKVNYSTGLITTVNDGTATITAKYGTSEKSYTLVVTIAEGTYFIKNRETLKYMQPDDNGNSHMEQHNFDGNDYQIWQISHVDSEYYYIVDEKTGLYLTAPNSDGDGKAITQESYISSDRQLWCFEQLDIGSYKIKAKIHSNNALVLAVGWGVNWNGINIEQKEINDNNNKDEWLLEKTVVSYIERELQKKSNWCWVTTARMFAKNSYPGVTKTQTDAVMHVKGSDVNDGGNLDEQNKAIHYFVENIDGLEDASINTVLYYNEVYSEEIIKKFIDDGCVIKVSRINYSDINDVNSDGTGHAMVIYGYVEYQIENNGQIFSDCRYLIRDPWYVEFSNQKIMSYEKLYNGRDALSDEDDDTSIWKHSIVIDTSYDDNTVPYYFDNN